MAINDDGPGFGFEGAGITLGIALRGTELIEIIVADDVCLLRQFCFWAKALDCPLGFGDIG